MEDIFHVLIQLLKCQRVHILHLLIPLVPSCQIKYVLRKQDHSRMQTFVLSEKSYVTVYIFSFKKLFLFILCCPKTEHVGPECYPGSSLMGYVLNVFQISG